MSTRSLAEVVAEMLKQVGLDGSLKGKAAVEAAKKELGVTASGPLKTQIQEICDQLGISTGWGGGGPAPTTSKASDLSTAAAAELTALRDTAKAAARAGKHLEAVQAYTSALAIAGEPSIYLARAQCYGKLENFKKMFEDACVCTKVDPDNWKGWDTAGQASMALEDYTTAHERFMKALGINPMSNAISQNMAKAAAAMRAGQSTWAAEREPVPESAAPTEMCAPFHV